MNNGDFVDFSNVWIDACEMSANKSLPSEGVLNHAFDLLVEYPLTFIKQAIDLHLRTNRFAPTVADILSIIAKLGGDFPTWEEAWASAPKDDGTGIESTVVVTHETWQCWWQVAETYAHDKVGARWMFKSLYEKLVEQNKFVGNRVKWCLYRGTDSDAQKAAVIKRAVQEGKLTDEYYVNEALRLGGGGFPSVGLLLENKSKATGLSDVAKREIAKCKALIESSMTLDKPEQMPDLPDLSAQAELYRAALQMKPLKRGRRIDALSRDWLPPADNPLWTCQQ